MTSQIASHQTAPAFGDVPPHRVWWALVQQRLEEARLKLPDDLHGVIQFFADDPKARFHLLVNGPKTQALEGTVMAFDAEVYVDDPAVEAMLLDPTSAKPAFCVRGDHDLYLRFFERLTAAEATRSWLEMRSGR